MIHIITDSMSDLLPEEAAAINVEVMPLYVYIDDKSYQDNVSITRKEFYERMKGAAALPKTSQVIPEAFLVACHRALDGGREILLITGSADLSGTYQSAVIALDMLKREDKSKVRLIDSRSCALGQALLVNEAARMRDAGCTAEAIEKTLISLIPHQNLVGQVEDLKYLVMGGRLPAVGGKIGNALNLKPMIRLMDGKLEMGGIVHGKRRALDWLTQQLLASPPLPVYPVYFASADANDALAEFLEYLERRHLLTFNYHVMGIGAVVGAHTGPGCIAVSWISGLDAIFVKHGRAHTQESWTKTA
jgi:DegV family protein with EDD domain